MGLWRASIVWLTLACPLAAVSWAQIAVDVAPFEAAAPVRDYIFWPDVAPTDDGGMMLIWSDYIGSTQTYQGFARRLASDGTPVGAPVRFDASGNPQIAAIVPSGSGGYAVIWTIGYDGSVSGGRLLDASGTPVADEVRVSAGSTDIKPSIVRTATGAVLLLSQIDVWGRRMGQDGRLVGDNFLVGDAHRAGPPDADTLRDGGFVAVWENGTIPVGRFFDATGTPRGPEFPVSDQHLGLGSVRVAVSPHGGFATLCNRLDTDLGVGWLFVRRFADDGTPLGPERILFTWNPAVLNVFGDLTFDDRGDLFVAWSESEYAFGGKTRTPRAIAFDPYGNPFGPPVPIGSAGRYWMRTVRLADGRIAAMWQNSGRVEATIIRLCGGAVCGDGVREACEECDDGAANAYGPDACRPDCRAPHCGDGIVDAGEGCDDGNTVSCDGCSAWCQPETGIVCGDGVRSVECGEECDAGAANGTTPDGCRADCRRARCGDGVVDTGEECDDGNDRACDGCGADCRIEVATPPACGPDPLPGTQPTDVARFDRGHADFVTAKTIAQGLGPVFNASRCADCHDVPVVGGSSARNITLIGTTSGGAFDPLERLGGLVLQAHGIGTSSCSVDGEVVPPEATIVARRNSPPLFGLGLLEAIPDEQIEQMARKEQRHGLSGHINRDDLDRIGRFGWKAQLATLQDFTVQAFWAEMGITSPWISTELAPQGVPTACDGHGDIETDGNDVRDITAFTRFLAPLAPQPSLVASRGKGYFRRLKCHLCHTDKYKVRRDYPIVALRGRPVPVFSDLLLHDLGPDLADGIEQAQAGGAEFRTAPLWGVRESAPYLHDGRAATLDDAIVAHGGEAAAAAAGFQALDVTRRAALIAYLKSL